MFSRLDAKLNVELKVSSDSVQPGLMLQWLKLNLGSKIDGFITKQVFQKYFFSGLRATSKNVISFLILSKDSIRIRLSVDLS